MNEGNKPKSHSVHTDDASRFSETYVVEVQPTQRKVLEFNLYILINHWYN